MKLLDEEKYAANLDIGELERIMLDGIAVTVDDCRVEPDGVCPHGFSSPLLVLGLI